MRFPKPRLFATAGLAVLVAACGGPADREPSESTAPDPSVSSDEILTRVLGGDHRADEERARDVYRHPKETLAFFELSPEMTVVEIWPGGGWYTNIIAPYLATGQGTYIAANIDPESSERARAAASKFSAIYTDKPDLYGEVSLSVLGEGHEIAAEGSADAVLTFRNVHNWIAAGSAGENFQSFYKALRSGGVLGVVEHRADPGMPEDVKAASGYVSEQTVINMAESAGFNLEASSQINANPADTKDHPFGVWTLSPVARSSAIAGLTDPDFDRAKYDAIGESDRMTLRFRKPVTDSEPSMGEAIEQD